MVTTRLSFALLAALVGCGNVTEKTLPDAPPGGPDDAAVDAGVDAEVPVDAPEVPPDVTLTLVPAGTGSGTITSQPAGIVCGTTCTGTFSPGTVVTLTADATEGSTFSGWGGACAGNLDTCSITLSADTAVNAGFARIMHTVTVAPSGNGTGSVSSSPTGITCPGTCTTQVPWGTQLTLAAAPVAPSTFIGWSGGGCAGTAGCTFTVTSDVAVGAAFALDYTLVVQKQGTGAGTVTSNPAGISCGADCSETYAANTAVSLAASPSAGSQFAGWTGACTGTGACNVTLDTSKSVTATFNLPTYTLTVAHAGTGTGRTISNPAGINCTADCVQAYNAGTSVTLTAGASVGSTFAGWSGACTGTGTCTVQMSQARAVTATYTKNAPNVAFVTSTTHTGNLGGLTGADAICRTRAAAAGLAGTYRAWLSTSTTNAISRLGSARGWVRTDGQPVVDSLADLTSGKMIYPLRVDENGDDVGHGLVFTGTKADGTLGTLGSCANWTSTASDGGVGVTGGLHALFSSFGGLGCTGMARIYCFGVDRTAVVDIAPPASYRRAFTTKASFTPGGGLAAADALCTQEAAEAGLPGTYRALLATTTATAASRVQTAGAPWVRLDGAFLWTQSAFTFSYPYWFAAPNLSADKTTWFGNTAVWSGARTLTTQGTVATTCNNWTSSSANATGAGGRAGMTQLTELANMGTPFACDAVYAKLLCLQQ